MPNEIPPFNNPPLAYVLAMVRMANLPLLEERINNIFECLRSDYPELGKVDSVKSFQVDIARGEVLQHEAPQWIMTSTDFQSGIIFRKDVVYVHTTNYKGFDEFIAPLKAALEALDKEFGLTHTGQLGYRYVNRIIPSQSLSIDQQIKDHFFGIDLDTNNRMLATTIDQYCETDIGRVKLTGSRIPSKQQLSMPNGLAETAKYLAANEKLVGEYEAVVLDIDHHTTSHKLNDYDLNELVNKLNRLHIGARNVFLQCVTPEAIEGWK